MNASIAAPERHPMGVVDDPSLLGEIVELEELCARAGVPLRVTGSHLPIVVINEAERHRIAFSRGRKVLVVGTAGISQIEPYRSLGILEVLAHGFHEYAVRETVCDRGLFRGNPA